MEHLDCGGELNFGIDSTGANLLACEKCKLAWTGQFSLLSPPGMVMVTNARDLTTKVRAQHPDWLE